MRRSRLLRACIALAGVLMLVAAAGAVVMVTVLDEGTSTADRLRFERPLHVPPLLQPARSADGVRAFDLRLQSGRTRLRPDAEPSETWGVNGVFLGPTLRATRGDRVQMRVTNHLPETTTMHWHGMHVPAVADGGPHQPIERGDTWRPRWRIDQPAATLWYHPHPHERTDDQVYRGLAGMWIIDEPGGPQRGLPGRYGVDDVPVLLQDKRFDDRGRLDFGQAAISPIGRLGDEILVNGSFRPYLTVTRQRTRLRLLNASSARHYRIGLADERPFALIAGDGGLLDAPKTIKHVQISPGERAEIVVTLQPGERVVLRSFKPELGTDAFNDYFSGGRDLLDLLELRADTDLQPSPEIPARLPSLGAPFVPPDARVRNFSLGGSNAINGRSMDMERIDQVVPLGETEIWKVENPGGTPHNFHIHGTQFRVLDIDGRPPPPHLTGLKDTISLPGESGLRLAVRFTDYADAQTPYMFHCHVLEHEDRGMMGQFVVVRPGSDRTPGRRQSPGSAHPSGHG